MLKGLVKSISKFIRSLLGPSSGKTCPPKTKRSLQSGDRERSGRPLDVSTVLDPIRWMFALLASGARLPRPVHAISLQSVPALMTRGCLSKLNLAYTTRGGAGNRVAALRLVGSPSVLLLTSMGVQCAIAANTPGIFIAHALDEQRLAANAGWYLFNVLPWHVLFSGFLTLQCCFATCLHSLLHTARMDHQACVSTLRICAARLA